MASSKGKLFQVVVTSAVSGCVCIRAHPGLEQREDDSFNSILCLATFQRLIGFYCPFPTYERYLESSYSPMVTGLTNMYIQKGNQKCHLCSPESHNSIQEPSGHAVWCSEVNYCGVKVACVLHSLPKQAMGHALAKRLGQLAKEEVELWEMEVNSWDWKEK